MAMPLKEATSVDVPIGPFLDETDGKTAETALTITQPDIRLKKGSAAWAQKAAAQTLSHEEAGWYEVTLDGTDTDTLGPLVVAIHESGALPVWREFIVVPANVYDSMVSTDKIQVDVVEIAGSTVSTSSAQFGVNVVNAAGTAWASGAITAASIAADAITAAKIADGAIDANTFATGAITATAIAADAIGASELADGAITAATFAAGAIDATAIADNAIDAASIATGAITSAKFAAGAIDAAAIATGAIDADAIAADAIGASELAAGAVDEILDDPLTDSVPADGALPTVRQALYMILQFLTERSVSSTTVTVNKVDGTTALMTFTLNDATTPTAITRAT